MPVPNPPPNGSDAAATQPRVGPVATWVASACVTGFSVGLLDAAIMTAVYPGVCSVADGAFQLWLQTSGLFVLLALPVAPLAARVSGCSAQRRLPRASSWLAAVLLAVVGTVGAAVVAGRIDFASLEFVGEMRVAVHFLTAFVMTGVALLFHPLRSFFDRLLAPRLERIAQVVFPAVAALTALLGSHMVFAAVHQLNAALVLGIAATWLMLLALGPVVRGLSARFQTAAVVISLLACLLGLFVPGAARDHARYMLYSHGASSARFAHLLRDLLDIDGDGSASIWLGGTDCAEGNTSVGPTVTEIPEDGIDQDCRGGDSQQGPILPRTAVPQHCGATGEPLSVLLIIVDALRGDHLTSEYMPGLSELASASTVFLRAYSPTGLTVTSFPSLLSGRPLSDLVLANPLADDDFLVETTLPERFRNHGYDTAVFSHLDFHAFANRGFDSRNAYWRDESLPNVKFDLTTAAMAQGVLEYQDRGSPKPSFVMLHLSDVHAPYPAGLEPSQERSEREAYAMGVKYTDLHIQQLFARMQRRGLLKTTIIVVTSDHGEELYVRGRHGHGHNTYEEGVRVPLVIWAPNCRPLTVLRPASTTQLAPTLGALSGVDVPGRGLFAEPELPTVVEGAMRSTLHFKRVVMQGDYKLVVDVPNGGRVLFDLARDPEEQRNIYGKEPNVAMEMERAYQRWLDAPGLR